MVFERKDLEFCAYVTEVELILDQVQGKGELRKVSATET